MLYGETRHGLRGDHEQWTKAMHMTLLMVSLWEIIIVDDDPVEAGCACVLTEWSAVDRGNQRNWARPRAATPGITGSINPAQFEIGESSDRHNNEFDDLSYRIRTYQQLTPPHPRRLRRTWMLTRSSTTVWTRHLWPRPLARRCRVERDGAPQPS